MYTARKIASLKREARLQYNIYTRARNNMDCGAAMAEHISRDVSTAKNSFNEIMDELAKIDPSTPNSRL